MEMLYFLIILTPIISIYLFFVNGAKMLGTINIILWISYFVIQFLGWGGYLNESVGVILFRLVIIVNILFLCGAILYYSISKSKTSL